MKLNNGLNTDVNPIDQPEGTYRDARNVVFSRKYNSISNEDGFDEILDVPTGAPTASPASGLSGKIIGVIPLTNDDWVAFITNTVNTLGSPIYYDEIGVVSNGTYTRKLRTLKSSQDNNLGFNENYPIKGRFRISNRGERIIGFTDNYNSPRVLNIDSLGFPVNSDQEPTEAGSINTLNIFTAGDPPTIDYTLNFSGGFVKSGTYLFSCSYIGSDNTETGYFTAIGPVKVNDGDGTSTAPEYDGCPAGTTTPKSISLSFTGVDTRYKYLNIGVISIIGGEVKFQKVGQIDITSSTLNFTFSGNETTEELLLEQLTSQSQGIYNTAKAITVLNDKLVLGNLSSRPDFDYQPYANGILIKWKLDTSFFANSTSNVSKMSATQEAGFRAFEVYAFYISFRYKDGSYSKAYHIPGRVSIPSELQTSSLGTAQGITAKKYQIEDTCSTDGTMSYWENENEVYPPDFPSFAGQNVRHHKFPSLNYLKANVTGISTDSNIGKTFFPVLSFDASNIVIPAELAPHIDGWQISFAKRTIVNQTCVGQGHLLFAHQALSNSNTSPFTPNNNILIGLVNANTNLRDLDLPGEGNLLAFPTTKSAHSKLTMHSPELLLNKPSFVATYVRNEFEYYNKAQDTTVTGIYSYINGSQPGIQRAIVDYVKGLSDTVLSCTATTSSSLIRRIANGTPLYVAPNVIDGRHYNVHSSEYIHFDIFNGDTLSISPYIHKSFQQNTSFTTGIIPGSTRDWNYEVNSERTYLSNICQLLKNVYVSYQEQELVTCTNIIPVGTSNTNSYKKLGDNYIQEYNYVSTMFRNNSNSGSSTIADFGEIDIISAGLKIARKYICESNIDIKFRHEGSDNNSKYLRTNDYSIAGLKENKFPLFDNWDTQKGYIIEYNTDYSVLNTFNPIFPENTKINTLNKFPYRVIISEANANELADSGWRTFLPNNYKDVITTKGEIVNLEGYDDMLLIHLQYALLRTVGTQTLKTSTEDVTIGTVSTFSQEPKEILISDLGYLGNQNLFGCGVTKLGYVFFDAQQGKIFIVGKDVKEISAKGLRGDIRDVFREDPVGDNPFISTGVNVAYDEKYNRLLLSKKGTKSFTLSYSPDTESFTSYHDYIPDYMFNTRNKVFSIKGDKIYQHNSETVKGVYYDTTVPSSITVIFNEQNNLTKITGGFKWVTDVVKPDKTNLYHKTFDKIMVFNNYQCSGDITLTSPTNIFNSETTWNFNEFYDIVKNRTLPFIDDNGLILSNLDQAMSWFKQRRFVDKWIGIKLSYNNIDQNTLFLYDVNALMRKASR